jgi:hypothetical protein
MVLLALLVGGWSSSSLSLVIGACSVLEYLLIVLGVILDG